MDKHAKPEQNFKVRMSFSQSVNKEAFKHQKQSKEMLVRWYNQDMQV